MENLFLPAGWRFLQNDHLGTGLCAAGPGDDLDIYYRGDRELQPVCTVVNLFHSAIRNHWGDLRLCRRFPDQFIIMLFVLRKFFLENEKAHHS